ncbi:hypothetical protein HH297_01360, partial [Xanthomonas sp. Kuri4-3]
RRPGRWFDLTLWAVAACGLAALLLYWLSARPQYNLQWIVLLLPIHAALALVLRRPYLSLPER